MEESALHRNANKRSKLKAPLAAAAANDGALPTDVLRDVLLCLPADELCRLRLVCRSWRSLTSDPIFAKAHSSRHNPSSSASVPTTDGQATMRSSSWTLLLDASRCAFTVNMCMDYGDDEPDQCYRIARLGSDGSGGGNRGISWTVMKPCPVVHVSVQARHGAVVNGVAYFLLYKDHNTLDEIAAFDLATEEWRHPLLRGPPSGHNNISAKEEDKVCSMLQFSQPEQMLGLHLQLQYGLQLPALLTGPLVLGGRRQGVVDETILFEISICCSPIWEFYSAMDLR
ncbi:hypothetical protein HU200_061464 [Digitaria exilis]|uniref:F-box domain-containing protein n=1 Tax=Digitaria exilis TaxID=1010633 RepID=A0A835A7B5_9POAL|nr:hypothetical protein HU200_061464 [Digitaria exilis]